MTSDPPSRIPPRNQPPNTKAAKEELSSKGKVEKVREVDADETRKRKFKSFLDEEKPSKDEPKPSLFDLPSKKGSQGPLNSPPLSQRPGVSSIEGLSSRPTRKEPLQSRPSDPLPRSEGFYDDADVLPDQPVAEKKMKKAHLSIEGKKVEVTGHAGKKPKTGQTDQKEEAKSAKEEDEEEEAMPSLPTDAIEQEKRTKWEKERGFDSGVKSVPARIADKEGSLLDKEALESEEEVTVPSFHVARREAPKLEKEKDGKISELAAASNFSPHVQATASAAVQQAAPYIHPTTAALFFQMVGQIHVMTDTGVSRTEILLNNPSFASSRFFGSTITIEKYATAPDSFNIRLTGSEQAVLSFKQNSASLMSAFQNGNFTFKVNRLDAEYTLERPVYRRKEKGEGKSGMGSDFGERK